MKKGRTIYLAGPMTGMPRLNYPKFRRVAGRLRAEGWKVVSPVEIGEMLGLKGERSEDQDKVLLANVIDVELRALRRCDAIYLMRGWERSSGTLKEVVIAISYGLDILLERGR